MASELLCFLIAHKFNKSTKKRASIGKCFNGFFNFEFLRGKHFEYMQNNISLQNCSFEILRNLIRFLRHRTKFYNFSEV